MMTKPKSSFDEAVERSEIIADAIVARLNEHHNCQFIVNLVQQRMLQTGVLMMLSSGASLSDANVELITTNPGRAHAKFVGVSGFRTTETILWSIRTGKAVPR